MSFSSTLEKKRKEYKSLKHKKKRGGLNGIIARIKRMPCVPAPALRLSQNQRMTAGKDRHL